MSQIMGAHIPTFHTCRVEKRHLQALCRREESAITPQQAAAFWPQFEQARNRSRSALSPPLLHARPLSS